MNFLKEELEKIARVAIFGCGGKMGRHYIEKLLNLGVNPKRIIGFDINQKNLDRVASLYPEISYTTSREVVFNFNPNIGIIAVNSTEHLNEITHCYDHRVYNIFCEKPLVYDSNQLARLRSFGNKNLYVAYLINFSSAVKDLFTFMDEQNLILAQFHSFWGKNWPGEKRMMGGDAEEEATHPLALALSLVDFGQSIKWLDNIVSILSFVPYVQPEYKQKSLFLEHGFGEKMNDSTMLGFSVRTEFASIPISISSSFNYAFQIRRVDLGLSSLKDMPLEKSGKPPEFKACLEFDCAGQDRIRILKSKTNELILEKFYGDDKIEANLEFALRAFIGQREDERLVKFERGAYLVGIIQAVLEKGEIK